MTAPALAPTSYDVVWFSGDDAMRFLNDLVSQEIGGMVDGDIAPSLLLTPRGKLDHIFWVVREGARFALVTEAGRGVGLAEALGRYRIRVDVDIANEESTVLAALGMAVATAPYFLGFGVR